MKKQLRMKFAAAAAALAVMSTVLAGCGSETEIQVDTEPNQAVETENETEDVQSETEAEEETESEEEETEPEETTEETEAETEEETEPEDEESEPDESGNSEEAGDIPTNIELIRMINDTFGNITDGTDESHIQVAKDWDIIDDEDIDLNAEITAEFLISAAMRCTGMVTGESTMDEIIDCAVSNGVIPDSDLSAVNLSEAQDIVDKAKYAWLHQDFDNEIVVELADGVVDLTNIIDVEDISIDGENVEIPSEYADLIEAGTVYILPKNPDTGEGGAYKAESVTEGNSATIIIKSVPAEITDVYKSISSN